MAYIMMMWGKYAFGINNAAYQQLQRSNEYRWPSLDLFGQQPQPQFTGEGDDVITLPGVIYPEWRGGIGQIKEMREIAQSGDPQILIDGRGNILGLYAATNITETQSEFGAFGIPRKQEFSITMKLVPDPLIGGNVGLNTLKKLAPGIAGILDAIKKAQSAIGAIKQAIETAQAAAQAVQGAIGAPFAAINSAAKLAKNTAEDFKNLAQNAENLVLAPAPTAANAIASANTAVQTIVQATPNLSATARLASDSLKTSLQAVVDAGAAPVGVLATQAVMVGANKQSSFLSKTFHSMSGLKVTT